MPIAFGIDRIGTDVNNLSRKKQSQSFQKLIIDSSSSIVLTFDQILCNDVLLLRYPFLSKKVESISFQLLLY